MSKSFVYEQVYDLLPDNEKLAFLQKEMKEVLGPEYKKYENAQFSFHRDRINEEIFDNYAEQGRLMKKLGIGK